MRAEIKNNIASKMNKGRAITAVLNAVLWNRKITGKKLQIYNSREKITVTYEVENGKLCR